MGLLVFLLFIVGCFVVYPLPTKIAAKRSHPKVKAIFILNLLAGWTVVGWAVALVWSCLPIATPSRDD
jgi:cell division protein FtsW (lipid II flippase)